MNDYHYYLFIRLYPPLMHLLPQMSQHLPFLEFSPPDEERRDATAPSDSWANYPGQFRRGGHPGIRHNIISETWPVPSKPPASPPEARPPASSRHQGRPQERLATGGRKSPTDTDLALWPFVRSAATRSPPSFSSASCPSSAWCVRSPRTSRRTFASRDPPSLPFRRPPRPTSSASSRTPTWPPSTPSVSPSCLRTSSWPAASVVSALKRLILTLID